MWRPKNVRFMTQNIPFLTQNIPFLTQNVQFFTKKFPRQRCKYVNLFATLLAHLCCCCHSIQGRQRISWLQALSPVGFSFIVDVMFFFIVWYEEAKVWICWYQAFSPVGFSFIFLKEKTSWATALSAKHTTITLFKTRSKSSKRRYLSYLYKCAASQEGIKVPRNFSPFSCEIRKYIVFVVVRGWASEVQQ